MLIFVVLRGKSLYQLLNTQGAVRLEKTWQNLLLSLIPVSGLIHYVDADLLILKLSSSSSFQLLAFQSFWNNKSTCGGWICFAVTVLQYQSPMLPAKCWVFLQVTG
jgi:hypothetical protein